MRLYEYEAKEIFQKYGLRIPRGQVAESAEEARHFAVRIGRPVVIKPQVSTKKRGKAGLIRFASNPQEVFHQSQSLLGTMFDHEKISTLWVEEKIEVDKEHYIALTIDYSFLRPVAIARSKWWESGWLGVRMGMAGFVAPFLFVYRPAVLLLSSPHVILWESLMSALGVMALAGGVIGYFGDKCKWYETVMLIGSAVLLIWPGFITDLVGILMVGTIYVLQRWRHVATSKGLSVSAVWRGAG